tara:strand:- start:485 stop:1363 length:879 start_codon:yes stop_codon:yes gene_type:complete
MKILILGGGQDGIIFSYLIAKKYNLDGLLIVRQKIKEFNYYLPVKEIGSFVENKNYIQLENIIEKFKPTHIINTVALSSTRQCNQLKELAMNINANFVKKLANFVKNKDLKLIHLGSILEKEYRPNCYYTKSKIMASKYIEESNNSNAFILRLPNHESPLRDKRFFIREIINLYQNNLENKQKLTINILDGKTKRDWSWAPYLMQKILEMIIKDSYIDNFNELTFNLSLIEFSMCIAKIFNLKEVIVICKKSGTYYSKNFIAPKVPESMLRWIKKMILVKNNEIYNLEKWCN